MIKVDDSTWLLVTEIEAIALGGSTVAAKIRMRSGAEYTLLRERQYTIGETIERLIDKINGGLNDGPLYKS